MAWLTAIMLALLSLLWFGYESIVVMTKITKQAQKLIKSYRKLRKMLHKHK